MIFVVVLTKCICKKTQQDFGTWLSVVIGVVGLIGIAITILKHDIKKHKKRCNCNTIKNKENNME